MHRPVRGIGGEYNVFAESILRASCSRSATDRWDWTEVAPQEGQECLPLLNYCILESPFLMSLAIKDRDFCIFFIPCFLYRVLPK